MGLFSIQVILFPRNGRVRIRGSQFEIFVDEADTIEFAKLKDSFLKLGLLSDKSQTDFVYNDGIYYIEARVFFKKNKVESISFRFTISNPESIIKTFISIISFISKEYNLFAFNVLNGKVFDPTSTDSSKILKDILFFSKNKLADIGLQ